jgi:predicted ribosomally synthesized peptide with nif11-like leader
MSRESIEALVERWMEDTSFRTAVRSNPEAAIKGTGLELSADEWAAVKNFDWNASDEELTTRASMDGCSSDISC